MQEISVELFSLHFYELIFLPTQSLSSSLPIRQTQKIDDLYGRDANSSGTYLCNTNKCQANANNRFININQHTFTVVPNK